MRWWSKKTREQKEDFFCEIGSWLLFVGICLLLSLCLGACRTVKTEVCDITEEYADSVAKDTMSEQKVIYSGYGSVADLTMEDVTIDFEVDSTAKPTGKVTIRAGKVQAHKEVTQCDSVVEHKTEASNVSVKHEKTDKKEEKTVKRRFGQGWMCIGLIVALAVTLFFVVTKNRIDD